MTKMKISEVRLGLATNSSSSHSVILAQKPIKDSVAYNEQYGWDNFTLATPESKLRYFGQALRYVLERDIGEYMARVVIRDLLGFEPNLDGYIDHSSTVGFPREWGKTMASYEFITDVKEWLMRSDVVILGGNDNSGGHPLGGAGTRPPWPTCGGFASCRKDGDYWVLYNAANGTKLRFSFLPDAPLYLMSTYPEQIDIKITDYCERGCGHCYQGSSREGKHAERPLLEALARQLEKMKVFEVALGGGEPTSHPQFPGIVRCFRRAGIVPNFTTTRLGWLETRDGQDALEKCGGFGYSPQGSDLRDLIKALGKYDIDPSRITIHLIPALLDAGAFGKALSTAYEIGLGVLLLGFKRTGRAAEYKYAKPYDWWLQEIEKMERRPRIAIDTLMAAEFEHLLSGKVSPRLFRVVEGSFSWYIDAVDRKMGACSFTHKLKPLPMKNDWLDGAVLCAMLENRESLPLDGELDKTSDGI